MTIHFFSMDTIHCGTVPWFLASSWTWAQAVARTAAGGSSPHSSNRWGWSCHWGLRTQTEPVWGIWRWFSSARFASSETTSGWGSPPWQTGRCRCRSLSKTGPQPGSRLPRCTWLRHHIYSQETHPLCKCLRLRCCCSVKPRGNEFVKQFMVQKSQGLHCQRSRPALRVSGRGPSTCPAVNKYKGSENVEHG